MKYSISLMTGLILLATNLQAQITTWYMTPSGTGTRDGRSWNNAFSGSNQQMIDVISGTVRPGDTLLIGGSLEAPTLRLATTSTTAYYNLPPASQTYTDCRFSLTGVASGSANAQKTIKGVDRGFGLPVFFGTQGTRSYTAINLTEDCSYLTIEDLDIRRRETAIATTGTAHKGIQLKRIKASDISESGFYFAHSDDMLVEECTVEKYNKYAFRIHYGCDKITFRNCLTDCTMGENDPAISTNWINRTASPIGFSFHEKNKDELPVNTNVLLDGCITRNNLGMVPSDYKQGDGFMVQQRNEGVVFRKCVADRASDSGYDLKGINQTINDSAAANCTKSGVKVWYQGTFNNFASVNNGAQFRIAASGTYAHSGSITINNSTLHSGTSTQEGIVVEKVARTSAFNNCLFTFASNAGAYSVYASGATPATFTPSGTGAAMGRYAYTATGTNPPRYVNPVIPWNGVGTNYDNQTFGTAKGYNSTVITPLPQPPIGRIISINLANSSTNTLASSEVVGVVPAPSWNNSTANNELMLALVDSGTATVPGVTALFNSTPYGYANSTVNHPAPMADDSKMMRSHRAGSNTTSTTATMTGVPYSTYDVYVYWGGRTTGESVPATMMVELQLLNTGTYGTAPNSTFYITDANRAWDGSYNESTATTSAAAADGNEFVVFRNLTAPEFRIRTSGSITRTGISGFQVVEKP